jgi:uncharacterized protein YdcH (DUF465 family)
MSKIKRGDVVKDVTTGEIDIIIDIQYVHNRYQVKDKSGWIYGIENIVDLSHDDVLAEVRRLKKYLKIEIAETERLNEENEQLKEDINGLENAIVHNYKTQIQRYKQVLAENIPVLYSVLHGIKNQVDYAEGVTLGGVVAELEKALKGE